jgi:hypothetical protein
MKLQKIIRVSMIAMGLGTALLLARPVCAQQEVDPQSFDATSDSSAQNQAVAQAAPNYQAAQAPAIASGAAAPLVEMGMEATQLIPMDTTVTGVLFLGIVLLGMVEVVRGSRRRTWKARTAHRLPSDSTTN